MSLITLNALQLRQLADAAASLRAPGGEVYYAMVTETDGREGLAIQQGNPQAFAPVGAVVKIDTADQASDRHPARVTIQGGEFAEPDTLDAYDAVFWSEAAVEKFVIPYYASKSLWMAGHVLERLSTVWYGFVPSGTGGEAGDVVTEVPIALAHLPGSDYVPLGDEASPGTDLVVLLRKPDGKIEHRPLTHYLQVAQPA